jgi:outer membrane protein assembly factor BamA
MIIFVIIVSIKKINKMKHLKNFTIINESNNSKERIESEINSAIEKYTKLFTGVDLDKLREKILKQAENNGYRGNVVIRKSPNDSKIINPNKYYIVYEPKDSALQSMGVAAANARRF